MLIVLTQGPGGYGRGRYPIDVHYLVKGRHDTVTDSTNLGALDGYSF